MPLTESPKSFDRLRDEVDFQLQIASRAAGNISQILSEIFMSPSFKNLYPAHRAQLLVDSAMVPGEIKNDLDSIRNNLYDNRELQCKRASI